VQRVQRALLATADAHGVRERFGLGALEQPERSMAMSLGPA
jgi:hypothetical protein